jgi:hypothetical protein
MIPGPPPVATTLCRKPPTRASAPFRGDAGEPTRLLSLTLDNITCENGVAVWSNGSMPRLRFDDLIVRNSDLSGPDFNGVFVGTNPDGSTLRGEGWSI